MDLFGGSLDEPINLLPYEGIANYYGVQISADVADDYFQQLLTDIAWRQDEAVIFGNRIVTKRKVAWYGDNAFEYTYSKTTKFALPWTPCLLELKALIELRSQQTYNSCLLNLYHDGSEGMAWHSDAETDLKKHAAIASLSLGAERKFSFKHKKTKLTTSLLLQHGSLLVMAANTQDHWLHRLPPTKKVDSARINLTFRTIAA